MLTIDFVRPGLLHPFHPGDTLTCAINVQSWFKINCKYVRVRLRCPYETSEAEVFQVYEIANYMIETGGNEPNYRIGAKGLCVFRCFVVEV